MKAKVAVVIPAYNAAKSITETIECLLQQTLTELQIIVVDDGSSDNTAEIAKQFASNDKRVLVISKPNGGAYSARRESLQYVDAEYLGFMDADDKAKPSMYEHMYNFAKGNNLEVVSCDIVKEGDESIDNEIYHGRQTVYDNVLFPMLVEGTINPTVWNHIYRVPEDGFKLKESKIMMGEDMVINLQFLKDIESYGRLHEGLYYYQINEGSSIRNYKPKNVDDFRENINYRKEVLSSWYNIDPNSIVSRKWVLMNAYNNFMSAAMSKAPSWSYRMENVKRLLAIDDIKESVDILNRQGLIPSKMKLINWVYTPICPLLVSAISFRAKLRKLMH